MTISPDPWRVLGLKPGSSKDDIKKTYRDLAMQYHPDLNHAPEALVKMKQINIAFGELMAESNKTSVQGVKGFKFTYGGYATIDDLINSMLNDLKGPGRHIRAFRVDAIASDELSKRFFEGITRNDFNPAKPVEALYTIKLTAAEANAGKTVSIKRKKRIQVQLPKNLKNGQRVILKNALMVTDDVPGNIILEVRIQG